MQFDASMKRVRNFWGEGHSRMAEIRVKVKTFLNLMLLFLTFTTGCAAYGETKNNLKEWIGKYPIDGTRNFIKEPLISSQVKAVAGPELYESLAELRDKPYYLLLPIEFAEGFYILHYPPNGHFNPEDERIFLLLNSKTLKVHLAHIVDGKLVWRHGESVPVPPQIENYVKKFEF